MSKLVIWGRVRNGLITTMVLSEGRITGHTRPIKRREGVQPVPPVDVVDIPPFMKKPPKPIEPPKIEHTGKSFADILREQQRILGN